MHDSAAKIGKMFFDAYVTGGTIVDIGSQSVDAWFVNTLKEVMPESCKYIGVDCCEGKNVDVVSVDPHVIPLADESADVVVSSSTFEHVEFFWELFLEMVRITKKDGLIYINAPSAGIYHGYPVDCWRFYKDAGKALDRWALSRGYVVNVLESFVVEAEPFRDWVGIFCKGHASHLHPNRIETSAKGL